MLYDAWQEIARLHARATALVDLPSNRRWTFSELHKATDERIKGFPSTSFPSGNDAGFIFELLRAWRHGCTVCPLESGQQPPEFPAVPAGIVHLKLTSASTGKARLVAFTPPQLMADPRNLVCVMGLRPDWPNLGAISLAHSYGFSNLVLPLLLHGIPLILSGSVLPEAILKASRGHTHLTLPAVPALWRAWLDAGAIPSNIKLGISAAAPLPLNLEQDVFNRTGLKIHNFYGSSECGGIAFDGSEIPRVNAAYAGECIKGVHLSINGTGLLEIRGNNVGECYWPEPDERLSEGRFRTNDLVELEGNRVFLTGRSDDVINIAGRKVLPQTIEKNLLTHPAVSECVILGVPVNGMGSGDKIIAFLHCREQITVQSLKDHLATALPPWQIPKEWQFMSAPLSNARGKISRHDFRKKYLEDKGDSGASNISPSGKSSI